MPPSFHIIRHTRRHTSYETSYVSHSPSCCRSLGAQFRGVHGHGEDCDVDVDPGDVAHEGAEEQHDSGESPDGQAGGDQARGQRVEHPVQRVAMQVHPNTHVRPSKVDFLSINQQILCIIFCSPLPVKC